MRSILATLLCSILLLTHPGSSQAQSAAQTRIPPATRDISDSLQTLLDEAGRTGHRLFLPAGLYTFSTTLHLPPGVLLEGEGRGASALQPPTNGTILHYTGTDAALSLTGTNSSIRDLTLTDASGHARAGCLLLADSSLVESVQISGLLIYGFTAGTALLLQAQHHGGIAYASFYDIRIRNARTGIAIREEAPGDFVNSNCFFHGVISGTGFDQCLLVDGGDNNLFYGTVMEPYTSRFGHLVVHKGQLTGDQIRIEAARQPTTVPVIVFGPASAGSVLTGLYGGGAVIDQGNNQIRLLTSDYAGESTPGSNELVNAAFIPGSSTTPGQAALPAYWTVSGPGARITACPERVIRGDQTLFLEVPPGSVADFYPQPGYQPTSGTHPRYRKANFSILARTSIPGRVKLTCRGDRGMVSSATHTGSGVWELLGLQVNTAPGKPLDPRIRLDNTNGDDTLNVYLTAPSLNFGLTPPPREPAPLSTAGGVMTGTLSLGTSRHYGWQATAGRLQLPLEGNSFCIGQKGLVIRRINDSTDRFPPGTILSLLFDLQGECVRSSDWIRLKTTFVSSGPNTSLTLLSDGDGTWRELNRNN